MAAQSTLGNPQHHPGCPSRCIFGDLDVSASSHIATLQLQSIKEQLVASDAKLDKIHTDQKVAAVNVTKNDEE
jgi:hypothetical protein